MITLKYSKENQAIFVSHIDLLKQFIRIINRADISIEYSQGFHPHMQMYLATPLTVGVSSNCEYVTLYTSEDTVIDRLNKASIGGLVFTKEYVTKLNPKLAASITRARYIIPCNLDEDSVKKVYDFFNQDSIKLEVNRKGETVETEVKPNIFEYKVSNNEINVVLACGNPNLRVDYLIKKIKSEVGLNIRINSSKKIEKYIGGNGEKVEDYLERIKE